MESKRRKNGRRGWPGQKRAGLGEFSSTTSQLHRIREEYFIQRPSFDENERERRANHPSSLLLRIINGQFAASAADCIVSLFFGLPSFRWQAFSLSPPPSTLCLFHPYSNRLVPSIHRVVSPRLVSSLPSLSPCHAFLKSYPCPSLLYPFRLFLPANPSKFVKGSTSGWAPLLKTCLSRGPSLSLFLLASGERQSLVRLGKLSGKASWPALSEHVTGCRGCVLLLAEVRCQS